MDRHTPIMPRSGEANSLAEEPSPSKSKSNTLSAWDILERETALARRAMTRFEGASNLDDSTWTRRASRLYSFMDNSKLSSPRTRLADLFDYRLNIFRQENETCDREFLDELIEIGTALVSEPHGDTTIASSTSVSTPSFDSSFASLTSNNNIKRNVGLNGSEDQSKNFSGVDVGYILRQLSSLYHFRYRYNTSSLDDLNSCICVALLDLDITTDTSKRPITQSILCDALTDKYRITEDLELITEAIRHGRDSLSLNSEEDLHGTLVKSSSERRTNHHTDDPHFWQYYGNALALRAGHCGSYSDANEAEAAYATAVGKAKEAGWPQETMASLRSDLAYVMAMKLKLARGSDGVFAEIEQGFDRLSSEILEATDPEDDANIFIRYTHARSLITGETRKRYNLEEAISILRDLIQSATINKPKARHCCKVLLAGCLHDQFESTLDPRALNECIELAQSVQQSPFSTAGDNEGLDLILTLACFKRYVLSENRDDLEISLRSCRNPTTSRSVQSLFRMIDVLNALGCIECFEEKYDAGMHGFRRALEVVPQTLMYGKQHLRNVLQRYKRMGPMAAGAGAACGQTARALESLELGRSIIWIRNAHMRTWMEELEIEHPAHAKSFKELSQLCETLEYVEQSPTLSMFKSGYTLTEAHDTPEQKRILAGHRWATLVDQIRKLDGYNDFLASPKWEDLAQVSSEGPVVIVNMSHYRNDAFIMIPSAMDRPHLVRLSDGLGDMVLEWSDWMISGTAAMTSGSIQEPEFSRVILMPIVRALWQHIVKPVRTALIALAPYARRIWWSPIGRLSFLPIHLATNGVDSDSGYMTLIPSYAITLSSLLKGRSSLKAKRDTKILAISCEQPANSSYKKITGTTKEVEGLRYVLGGALPHGITTLQGPDATIKNVLATMPNYSWLHLACHGVQTFDESYGSHFALFDGSLRLGDIVSTRFENPEFAFLSSCHTATGIPDMSDEAMHLAAGLHFAGFSGTIATMWSVHDDTAKRLTEEVYAYLFMSPDAAPRVENAAEALWKAIEKLKRDRVPLSRLAPFIHIGI